MELSIAKEVINIGFAKSADSLSFFLKQKVLFKAIDFEIKEVDDVDKYCHRNCDLCVMLVTPMMGDINGVSYLIFSKEEADKLLELGLPEEVRNDPEKFNMMSEAILLEIDNIITAAVVTQFSMFLKKTLYGGIPYVMEATIPEIDQMIKGQSVNKNYFINFKAAFYSPDVKFTPEFIWLLDDSFMEGIKDFAKENNVSSLMNGQEIEE